MNVDIVTDNETRSLGTNCSNPQAVRPITKHCTSSHLQYLGALAWDEKAKPSQGSSGPREGDIIHMDHPCSISFPALPSPSASFVPTSNDIPINIPFAYLHRTPLFPSEQQKRKHEKPTRGISQNGTEPLTRRHPAIHREIKLPHSHQPPRARGPPTPGNSISLSPTPRRVLETPRR